MAYRSNNDKYKSTLIVVEIDAKSCEKMLALGTIKIGWKICEVQDNIGILRCYKCSGYYHMAIN